MDPGDPITLRDVAVKHRSHRTMEGGGFPVRRPFPVPGLSQVDPFLLLDEMGPVDWPPGGAIGAPSHPHRGFETVTYLLAGEMEHRDSRGNVGHLGPGGVQWMTAGAGVVHSELPTPEFRAAGGTMHGFQIWVNLPRALKMIEPRYQDVPAATLPIWRREDEQVTIRVIAGEAEGCEAVAQTHTPITLLHLTLAPGASHTLRVPEDQQVCAYLFKHTLVTAPGEAAHDEGAYLVFGHGDALYLEAGALGADLLILGAVPIGEPVARYGPFVMTSREELQQAFRDYEAGRLG